MPVPTATATHPKKSIVALSVLSITRPFYFLWYVHAIRAAITSGARHTLILAPDAVQGSFFISLVRSLRRDPKVICPLGHLSTYPISISSDLSSSPLNRGSRNNVGDGEVEGKYGFDDVLSSHAHGADKYELDIP